jgi:hypothetical protein
LINDAVGASLARGQSRLWRPQHDPRSALGQRRQTSRPSAIIDRNTLRIERHAHRVANERAFVGPIRSRPMTLLLCGFQTVVAN